MLFRNGFFTGLISDSLPGHDDLLQTVDSCITVLESEDNSYRPEGGGLLDFTQQIDKCLVIVPDLHARIDFMRSILEYDLSKIKCNIRSTVREALKDGKLRIVCVGDLFHSEARCKQRWIKAYGKYKRGNILSREMKDEMADNLNLLSLICKIKTQYPDSFHFLKGNHENILNSSSDGNHAFYKYAEEGQMVYDFMHEFYGDALTHVISCFEKELPLAACFNNCVVSHAEPVRAFSREEIISKSPEVTEGLTWTKNGEASEGSVYKTIVSLIGEESASSAKWFTGHRAVSGKYQFRQNDKLVQIHNPSLKNIVLLQSEGLFNPERDIINIK